MSFKGVMDYFQFSSLVQRKFRYALNVEIQTFLSNVLETSSSRVATVPQGQSYWRAQIGHEETEKEDMCIAQYPFSTKRMLPDYTLTGNGRISPKGIATLYLASTKSTAMSEARPWKQSQVSCARFVTSRSLRIIDCSVHADRCMLGIGCNTPQEIQELIWSQIDNAFSKPVSVGDESSSYIPTQILAELFKANGFDGVGYKSSLTTDGYNLALFELDSAVMADCQLFTVKNIAFEFTEASQLMRATNK